MNYHQLPPLPPIGGSESRSYGTHYPVKHQPLPSPTTGSNPKSYSQSYRQSYSYPDLPPIGSEDSQYWVWRAQQSVTQTDSSFHSGFMSRPIIGNISCNGGSCKPCIGGNMSASNSRSRGVGSPF